MLELSMRELGVLAEQLGGRPRKDGNWHFIHWGNDEGVLWFWFEDDGVMIPLIRSPQPGTLGLVAGIMPVFLRDYEVTQAITPGAEPKTQSYRWLLGVGFEREREDGLLIGSIDEGRRFDQYRNWQAGGEEPDWHQHLADLYAQFDTGLPVDDPWYQTVLLD